MGAVVVKIRARANTARAAVWADRMINRWRLRRFTVRQELMVAMILMRMLKQCRHSTRRLTQLRRRLNRAQRRRRMHTLKRQPQPTDNKHSLQLLTDNRRPTLRNRRVMDKLL